MLAVLLVTLAAWAQEPTEQELQAKADAALSQNDWKGAVPLLEALITKFPQSKNEQVFWDITKLCDSYGLDHEKAITYYRLYAERFPGGRFSARFKDRLAYLESHRQDWAALKQLAAIQAEYHTRPPAQSLAAAEQLSASALSPSAQAEVSSWLASQLLKLEQYRKARTYAERYVATFPANGKGTTAHVQALQLCAKIASKQGHYGAAIERLEQIEAVDRAHMSRVRGDVADLRFHQKAQRVFFASAGFIALALAAVAACRPWRRKRLGIRPVLTAVACGAVVLLSAGPGAFLLLHGERVPPTFWALAVAGCLAVILLQVATAAVARTGRALWAALAMLFVCAMVYSAMYVTGTVKVLDPHASAEHG